MDITTAQDHCSEVEALLEAKQTKQDRIVLTGLLISLRRELASSKQRRESAISRRGNMRHGKPLFDQRGRRVG